MLSITALASHLHAPQSALCLLVKLGIVPALLQQLRLIVSKHLATTLFMLL
jgi:hypothetical protein